MRIQDSAIFKQHPDAGKALLLEYRYRNYEGVCFLLMVIGVVTFFTSMALNGNEPLGAFLAMLGVFLGIGSVLNSVRWKSKGEASTQHIREKVRELAKALGTSLENLCATPVTEIKLVGSNKLARQGREFLHLSHQWATRTTNTKASELDQLVKALLRSYFEEKETSMEKLRQLLIEFEL